MNANLQDLITPEEALVSYRQQLLDTITPVVPSCLAIVDQVHPAEYLDWRGWVTTQQLLEYLDTIAEMDEDAPRLYFVNDEGDTLRRVDEEAVEILTAEESSRWRRMPPEKASDASEASGEDDYDFDDHDL